LSLDPSTKISVSVRVISGSFGNADNNALEQFGLSYTELAQLVEEGLVRPIFGEGQDLTIHNDNGFIFEHASNDYLIRLDPTCTTDPPPEIRLGGPFLTRAGFELRQVVAMQTSDEYLGHLSKWLASKNYELFRVTEKLDGAIRGYLVPHAA
jgi:hypothetical protein